MKITIATIIMIIYNDNNNNDNNALFVQKTQEAESTQVPSCPPPQECRKINQ